MIGPVKKKMPNRLVCSNCDAAYRTLVLKKCFDAALYSNMSLEEIERDRLLPKERIDEYCSHKDLEEERFIKRFPYTPNWCPVLEAKQKQLNCDVLDKVNRAKRGDGACQEFIDNLFKREKGIGPTIKKMPDKLFCSSCNAAYPVKMGCSQAFPEPRILYHCNRTKAVHTGFHYDRRWRPIHLYPYTPDWCPVLKANKEGRRIL